MYSITPITEPIAIFRQNGGENTKRLKITFYAIVVQADRAVAFPTPM